MKKLKRYLPTYFTLLALFLYSTVVFSQAPIITSFSPDKGSIGSLVTITGSNLGNPSSFTIGGVTAIVVLNSPTKLVGMVMPGAVTGSVLLTTAGGSATGSITYTVLASRPPFTQEGNKLFGTGSVGGNISQGWASALSADGTTAIVGGPNDRNGGGAAWVYTKTGTTWTQQGLKIAGADSIGDPYEGWSVAINADGNTALIGGPSDSGGIGATWVFVRSGNSWSQQGNKLKGSNTIGASPYGGNSVSLSADGNMALIGAPYDDNFKGAIWIFKRNGTTWTQQGGKLTGAGITGYAALGYAVSLSADGKTALAGGFYDNNNLGAAWVFTTNGSTWSQQAKLVGSGYVGTSVFQGYSVGISANGNTAIIGGIYDNNSVGAAWVFTRSGTTWTQQGSKLIGSGYAGSGSSQGNAVSISADGNTALSSGNYDDGNNGATWVFTRNGNTWSQSGNKLIGTGSIGSPQQGSSLSLSADGNNAIIGGYADNSLKGAVWIFIPASDDARLSNLTISSGVLSPVFSGANTAYTVSVSNAVSSVTVTPTLQNAGATIQAGVNSGSFSPVTNGTASAALVLNVGSNIIEVVTTAQDGTTTKTYTITVIRACPGVSAVLTGNAAICAGATTNINVNVTGGIPPYTVVYSGGTLNNYANGSNIPVSPSATTTFALTSVTDGNNCAASVSGSALITIKTNAGIISATAANSAVCPGGTTTLTANGITGTNAVINWWSGTGGTGSNLGTGVSLPNRGAGTYYARVTADCGSPVESFVTISTNPVPSVGNQTTSTCSGIVFDINPSGVPAGTTYSWTTPTYSGSVSGGSSQTAQSSVSQTLSNSGVATGTATYTITPYAGSCSGAPFLATISIYPVPVPVFTASPSSPACAGIPVTYTTESGMSDYRWNVTGVDGNDYTIVSGDIGLTSNTVTLTWLTAGSKDVTVNYKNANNCIGALPATANVTVNIGPTPSVTIPVTAGTNPSCVNNNVTFTAIPVNAGSLPAYQWYVNGIANPADTNNTYTVTNVSTSNTPLVYVEMTVTPGLCVTASVVSSGTENITLVSNVWAGGFSNQWGDGRNWCSGTVPVATSDISIPVTARNPVISGNTAVNKVNISTGAVIIISNCNLIVNGPVSGTGIFSGTGNSGLILTASGTIGNLYFDPTGIGSLKLSGGGSATLANPLNIYNELNVGNSILDAGDNLTLKSNLNGTAWIAPVTGIGNIIGNVIVERYIPQNAFRAWRLLSVPVKGTQSFKQSWQENQVPMANNLPGYGTLLTSAIAGNGYDAQTAGNSLLQFNNGTPGSFSPVTNTNNITQTASGYFVYIRGDRSASISVGVYSPTATTLRTKGELYIGSQPVVNLPAGQNVMVGNVYASALDFDYMVKSGVTAFKVWDPKLLGSNNLGAYQTFTVINGYDPIPGGGSYGNADNSRIESGQAFIVGSSTGGSIQLTESAKTTGSKNVFRNRGTAVQQLKTRLYVVTNTGRELADGNAVVFNDNYSNDNDDADVPKVLNMGENFGLSGKAALLSIEGRRKVLSVDTLLYRMSNLKQKDYSLEFIPQNIEAGLQAYLEDKWDGSKTPVNMTGITTYKFSVTADAATWALNRFRLVLVNKGLPANFISLKAYQKNKDVQLNWKVNHQDGVKQYEIEHSMDGTRFNTLGIIQPIIAGTEKYNYTWMHRQAEQGDHYYRVRMVKNDGSGVYSPVDKIILGNGGFNVFPNPVTGSRINIAFIGQEAGAYTVNLLNREGRMVFNAILNHLGGNDVQMLRLPSDIATGSYQLQIIAANKVSAVQNLVISNK